MERKYGKKGELQKFKLVGPEYSAFEEKFIIDLREKLSKMKSQSAFKEKKSMNVVHLKEIENIYLNETINSQKHLETHSTSFQTYESNNSILKMVYDENESIIYTQIDETLTKKSRSPPSPKNYDFFRNESEDGGFEQNYE